MAKARVSKSDLNSIFAKPAPAAAARSTPPSSSSTELSARPARIAASREGKRGKLVYLTEAAEKQLTFIGAEYDKTQQALMIEAVNLLFERYGRDQIA
ncbi:MAG: hypothetical protein JNM66_07540 [Bryobacterales bacterium]|nr:hypothetical protein [Bryobacterales bacterium]